MRILSLWTLADSNRLPPECKTGALPIELRALASPHTRRVEGNKLQKEQSACIVTHVNAFAQYPLMFLIFFSCEVQSQIDELHCWQAIFHAVVMQ